MYEGSLILITGTIDLATGALSLTTGKDYAFQLLQITLKASKAITETITITLDTNKGANYDVVLSAEQLIAGQNFIYKPEGICVCMPGDNIVLSCTNNGLDGIVYAQIYITKL